MNPRTPGQRMKLAKLERDKGDNPSRELLEKIAKLLDLPATELAFPDLPQRAISPEAEVVEQNYDSLSDEEKGIIRVIIMQAAVKQRRTRHAQ